MELPEICIEPDTDMLDRVYKPAWLGDPRFAGKPYPEPQEIVARVKEYNAAWAQERKQLLEGMCGRLKLTFRQNVIYVHVVGRAFAMSHPVVLDVRYSPDYFVDVLTHELLHRLLSDYKEGVGGEVWEILNRKYLPESSLTKNHILVHAVHAYLFLDVLKAPARLAREVDFAQDKPAYKRAWDIVGSKYNVLIDEFLKDEKWPDAKAARPPANTNDRADARMLACDRSAEVP